MISTMPGRIIANMSGPGLSPTNMSAMYHPDIYAVAIAFIILSHFLYPVLLLERRISATVAGIPNRIIKSAMTLR